MIPRLRRRPPAACPRPRLLLALLLAAAWLEEAPAARAARPPPAGKPPAAAAPAQPKRPPTELSNSFIITSLQDLLPIDIRGTKQTPCEYAVARARGLGQKRFSLVVTAYWGGGSGGVSHYSFKDVNVAYPDGVKFPEASASTVKTWQQGIQRCFKAAADAGFTGLQILNHIDSEDGLVWRNVLPVDPLAKVNGWSYDDVVVAPAAAAIKAVLKPQTKLWFMVNGEMGNSLWHHPASYLALIGKYRAAFSPGRRPGSTRVGMALHWNKVCGNCFYIPHVNSQQLYNTTYHELFVQQKEQLLKAFDAPAVKRALEAADVLGISHYAPAPMTGVTPGMFAMPIDTAAYELSHWGIDFRALINAPSRDFLFSEIGLGGADPANQRAAGSLEELAGNPLYGIWAVYNTAQDPWRNSNYKSYRRMWFKALVDFLQAGGGPRYKVDAAFIWSVGTWDVAAIHPISTSAEGTYADWEIVKWMRWLSNKVPSR